MLRGFPHPASEAAYLAYKNGLGTEQVDRTVIASLRMQALSRSLASGAHWLDTAAGCLVLLLYLLPAAVLLLARPWYCRHRERLMLVAGAASRLAVAVLHGVLSLAWGCDMCLSLPHCLLVLCLGASVHYPLLHQMRFKVTAPLVAVDAVGVACYGAYTFGSGWQGGSVGGCGSGGCCAAHHATA